MCVVWCEHYIPHGVRNCKHVQEKAKIISQFFFFSFSTNVNLALLYSQYSSQMYSVMRKHCMKMRKLYF